MIKYKFENSVPNKKQKAEILKYIYDSKFIKILELTNRYFIQDEHGEYEFTLSILNNIKYITIRIYSYK